MYTILSILMSISENLINITTNTGGYAEQKTEGSNTKSGVASCLLLRTEGCRQAGCCDP